jgi:hypothetical protein
MGASNISPQEIQVHMFSMKNALFSNLVHWLLNDIIVHWFLKFYLGNCMNDIIVVILVTAENIDQLTK